MADADARPVQADSEHPDPERAQTDREAVHVVAGPVAGHHLAQLRNETTGPEGFRHHAEALGALLAQAALRDVPARTTTVSTPLGPSDADHPAPPLVAVPVLRAGLGLLPGVLGVLPQATVGMVGLQRNEQTLEPEHYYRNLPPLDGAWVLVLEPMLATGGSASAAVRAVAGADQVTVLGVVATRTGIDRIVDDNPGTAIVTAAIDPELDDNGYIVPGLGDFGDRLYGTPHATGTVTPTAG